MWFDHRVMCPKDTDKNGKQCRPWSDCLIWAYTVCPDQSVPKLRIISASLQVVFFSIFQTVYQVNTSLGTITIADPAPRASTRSNQAWRGATGAQLTKHRQRTDWAAVSTVILQNIAVIILKFKLCFFSYSEPPHDETNKMAQSDQSLCIALIG